MRNPKRLTFLIVSVALVCLLAGGRALAQTTLVTLEGVVTDEQGIALPGVAVTVRSMDTGYELSSVTRTDGRYIISGIQPGKYEVDVSISGFVTRKRQGLTFAIGAKLKIDFSLQPSAIEEEVTVIAESPMVEVTKSDISSVVNRREIEDLPLLNRDFTDLSILKAGVLGGETGNESGAGMATQSNAMPTGMAELMIDGMSNENIIQNGARLPVPADAIQEFRILTNQFETEYGNASGMVRTAITRSGTNDLRGRLNYFYRDEGIDTPNYFVNHEKYKGNELPEDEWEKAPYKHHNFAGFLGGPIVKDKAHFFISYDGLYRTGYAAITSPLVAKESIDQPQKRHLGLLKLTYQPNEKHIFSLRGSMNFDRQDNQGVGGLNTRERAYIFDGKGYEFQLNWTYFPSDNSINEFRAIYVIDDANFDVLPEFRDEYSIVRPSGNFGKNNNFDQYNFADRYQFVDNFTLYLGDHTVKTGLDYMYIPSGVSVFDLFIPGQYTFNTDAPFDANDASTYPFQFMYNVGDPAFTLYIHEFGAFVQDSWRVSQRLTLNYGLRYSYFTYTGLTLSSTDFSNFNPRFGFSYDPTGDGKTVIRGGIGTYTANVMANIAFPNEFYKDMQLTIIMYPGYPDPFQRNPFVPSGEIPIRFDEYEVEEAPNPYSLQITLGAQREILPDFSLGLDLLWVKGYNLITWENKNPVIPGTSWVRDDPSRGNVWYITNRGKSDYKAAYLSFTKRYSNGWSLDIGYTLGKAEGNTERQDRPWSYEADAWDRAYGRKDRDARHKFTIAGIVDIPFGFQLSGIVFYRSSYPWNATRPGDENLDSLRNDYVDQYRNSREGFDWFYINARISWYLRMDQFSIQLFAEVYNVTNRANFFSVHNDFGTEDFGNPTLAGDPRLLQLGVRFNF